MTGTATPPPVHPSAVAPSGPKWPKIIGILCLILAGVDLVQALAQSLNIFLIGANLAQFAEAGAIEKQEVDDFMSEYIPFQLLSGAVLGALALILLFGGVLLLRKKRLSIPLLRAWSIVKIVVGSILVIKAASLMKRQLALVMEASTTGMGDQEAAMIQSIVDIAGGAGMAMGIVFLILLPVFLLVWFNREGVRSQFADWS